MGLPLVVAGPVLRRVEPNLVTVWIALSRPADVHLFVYLGLRQADDGSGGHVTSGFAPTIPIGKNLHVATVTARTGLTRVIRLIPARFWRRTRPTRTTSSSWSLEARCTASARWMDDVVDNFIDEPGGSPLRGRRAASNTGSLSRPRWRRTTPNRPSWFWKPVNITVSWTGSRSVVPRCRRCARRQPPSNRARSRGR